jgi:pantoate--beta-alanine ligase
MRTFQKVGPLRTYLRGIREEGKSVGFVPTMGALHEGHLSLIRRARADCDLVVVSIFINPTQFGPEEDFARYPRDLNRDLQMTSSEGVDALFAPSVEEMYPPGFQTAVDVPELSATLEGVLRPGHFRGVATVVAKLLNIVQPDRAYFGQKDYQQFLVIDRIARDLNLTPSIVMVPTIRESDGLAISSRNVYLSPEERQAATILYRALQKADTLVKDGERDPTKVQAELETLIAAEALANREYVALVNPETLEPVTTLGRVTLVALAVRVGKTRLIDNALVAPDGVATPKNRGSRH